MLINAENINLQVSINFYSPRKANNCIIYIYIYKLYGRSLNTMEEFQLKLCIHYLMFTNEQNSISLLCNKFVTEVQ